MDAGRLCGGQPCGSIASGIVVLIAIAPSQGETHMTGTSALRRYLAELVVVFVGVALAFAVENLREDMSERAVGDQYMAGFSQDLAADREMLQAQYEARRTQLENAAVVLEFFEGRAIDPQAFFERYYVAMLMLNTHPNRNTMQEVLSSGNLRLIHDTAIRTGLLSLYATYDRIAAIEEHMERDFASYLYDPTFSAVPLRFEGPWPDTPENRKYVETLLGDIRIENGFRLIVANLEMRDLGLLAELELARSETERILEMVLAAGASTSR